MNIIPKLNLNKHPKDCDLLSLVNAKNIKISNDLAIINNEEDIIEHNVINNFIKTEFNSDQYKIVGIIPCNDELVIFAKLEENNGKIFRYNEKLNKCKLIYSSTTLLNNVNEIKGTFTYNVENDLIIAVSLLKNNEDSPLRTFNLGNFEEDIAEIEFKDSVSSLIPEVILPSISHYYYKGSCYKGWYYLYIRFKINKTDYTQWYNFGYPIFIDDISRQQIFRYCYYQYRTGRNTAETDIYNVDDYDGHSSVPMDGFGIGCYDGFSENNEISNTTFGIQLNFNNVTDFKYYQLGFVCANKSYTKAFVSEDINIIDKNYIFNPKYITEGSITEFITSYYNYFNVKNIINYKNRLYISNYKELSLNKYIDQSIIDNTKLELKVTTSKCSLLQNGSSNGISTVKRIVTLIEARKNVESGQAQLKTPKQYFLDVDNVNDLINQSIPFNQVLNVDKNINIIIITNNVETGQPVYTSTPISNIYIVGKDSATSILPQYCKIKINNNLYDSIQYCLETDIDSNGKYTNIKNFIASNYIITRQKECIDTTSSFKDRLSETTLIPGEVYNFFIHYVDKYGHATNGYQLKNNSYIKKSNGDKVVPIKIKTNIQTLYDAWIAVSEDYTVKDLKDYLNTSSNLSLYTYNYNSQILVNTSTAIPNNEVRDILLTLYGELFSYNTTKYDHIRLINIFNTGRAYSPTNGYFGAYINDNGDRLFKIPDEEYYESYGTYTNYKYELKVTTKIPDGYIGYFISYEKFESSKKVTGFLTNSDAREISMIKYNEDGSSGITFNNYENNNIGSYMYLYSSTFDIKDSLSLDYNFLKIKAKSTKKCTLKSANLIVENENYPGFTEEMSISDINFRNSSIKYAYNLNKSLIKFTEVDNVLYGISDYKLVIADAIKDDRGGLSTALQLKNIENLFISDYKYRINTYIANIYNYHNKLYINKDKTLIRIGNIIYGSNTVTSNIQDGFNGLYTYDGLIVYNNSGILFNTENNKLYNNRGKLQELIPNDASNNKGPYVTNLSGELSYEGVFYINQPFLNYVQFPVIDTYYYESKHFNNNPQNVIFSIIKPDEQDPNAKGYWPGMIVEPKNSIDLFSNPQGGQDDFITTVYNNYRDDLLNIETYNKTVRRSNVIQDENRINAWRQFPTEGYKNINENKGIITNLIGIGVYILVHTEHSLFMFNGDATLKTQDKSLQLEQPDAFDTNYIEVFTSDLGFGGLQDDKAFIVDQFGYIFYNNDFNRFYKFDNGKLSVIDQDIYLYLQTIKPFDVRFANDKNNNRLLIRMSGVSIKYIQVTLSYNYELGNFISFHDYDFNRAYNTKTNLYLEKNILYNFTKEFSFGTYAINNNKLCNSEFTVIINEDYDNIKFLEFIKYNLRKSFYNKLGIKEYCGDYLQVFNDYCNTGEIDIHIDSYITDINKFNKFNKPRFELGNWNFNYFRNNITSRPKTISDKLTRIYGNYLNIRFIFDNKDKCLIEFENLTGSVSKQRKL